MDPKVHLEHTRCSTTQDIAKMVPIFSLKKNGSFDLIKAALLRTVLTSHFKIPEKS